MTSSPNLLRLAPYTADILRKVTSKVNFPLDESTKQAIEDMLYSIRPAQLKLARAPFDSAVGMAANQWGLDYQIFIYCPKGCDKELTVMINPEYIPNNNETEVEWEGCFSIPMARGKIQRFTSIQAKYYTVDANEVNEILTGFEARVFQHECDHLQGILYDDNAAGKCLEKIISLT